MIRIPWAGQMEEKFVGQCVASHTYSQGWDSDPGVMVVVWDQESDGFHQEYATGMYFTIDAPAAVKVRYHAERDARQQELNRAAEAQRAAAEAAEPKRGRLVRVVRGRKVPRGTEGRVFWYGSNRWGYSVGIQIGEERVFTAAHNVEVIGAEVAPEPQSEPAKGFAVGQEVVVTSGDDFPMATVGKVFWYGMTRYGQWRVGVKAGDVKKFTAVENVSHRKDWVSLVA